MKMKLQMIDKEALPTYKSEDVGSNPTLATIWLGGGMVDAII